MSKWLGLREVYAACEREGSLDRPVRKPVVNDFAQARCLRPGLQAIAHNGGESFKQARHAGWLGLPVYPLPAGSPAHASGSFERQACRLA